MKGRGRLIPTAVALVAAAALFGVAPVAVRTPADCPPAGTVSADTLTAPVPVRACSLAGAVVAAGTVAVRVPGNDGESVTAAGSGRDGHPTVLTVTRAAGSVRARIWRPDGEAAPRRHAPFSRLGRADGQPAEPPTDAPPASAAAPAGIEAAPTAVRCGDSAGSWLGMRWHGPYRWMLRTAGTPAYLGPTEPVRDAIREAAQAVDEGRNDCGIGGDLALSQRYVGETGRDAGISPDGTCTDRDDRNVVAFGRLDGGLLALTCLWWSRGRTVESDIRISDVPGTFALNPAADCTGSWDLQGTLTHEFGHVFGLGHVSFAEHGELTMSDGLPACSTGFRALGLGDYETLRGQYGTN